MYDIFIWKRYFTVTNHCCTGGLLRNDIMMDSASQKIDPRHKWTADL
jgi:hypothetical protein